MRRAAPAVALLLLASPAAAGDRDLARCAAMDDAIKRLACYDALAAARDAVPRSKAGEAAGAWAVRTTTSPIDDSRNVFLQVEARDEIPGKYGVTLRPTLNLACRENKTSLWVHTGQFVTTGKAHVTYRIDRRDARDDSWPVATNHQAFGLWSGSRAIPLLRAMADAEQLLIRFTPYGENAVTVVFPVAGLDQAVRPLANACGWALKPPPPPEGDVRTIEDLLRTPRGIDAETLPPGN